MPRRRMGSSITRVLGAGALLVAALQVAGPPGVAAPGASGPYKNIPAEPLLTGPTIDEEIAQQGALHAWLLKEAPEAALANPTVVRLTDAERDDLKRAKSEEIGRAVVGRTKGVDLKVRFSGLDAALLSDAPRRVAGGYLRSTPDGGFVWAGAFRAEGAGAVRVHIGHLELPPEADLYIYSPTGQAFGPYNGRGPTGHGDFWTHTVFGSDGVIVLRHFGPAGAGDLARTSFVVSEVGHLGKAFTDSLRASTESFCSFNVACIENASCFNVAAANPAKSAVALMQWIQGSFIYTCTGGLLNDTVSTSQIPYFLTANHCLSSGSVAANLEAYFQFSLSCGSTSCPGQTNPGGIQRLGATVKATGSAGDFTLLQLNQTPPGGSTVLGWKDRKSVGQGKKVA